MQKQSASYDYLRENLGPPKCPDCGQKMTLVNQQGLFECPECGRRRDVFIEDAKALFDCL